MILLKDNKPAYIILKYNETHDMEVDSTRGYKLHEAMKMVLLEVESKIMHASELADEIYNRRLYLQKNSKKAQYTQIRARCGHYPDMFEALPGNMIKLKERL